MMPARAVLHSSSAAPRATGIPTLVGLSLALDLAHGWEEEHSRLAAALAWRLAADAGEPIATRGDAYVGALLLYLGCSGAALGATRFTDDDRALRGALSRLPTTLASGLKAVVIANPGLGPSLAGLFAFGRDVMDHLRAAVAENCGAARDLAGQLRCRPEVIACLDDRFEHWNGHGNPSGKAGDAISPIGRIARAAHFAVHTCLAGGPADSHRMLQQVSGSMLEPRWATAAMQALPLLADPAAIDAIEAQAHAELAIDLDPDVVAGVFADFTDLQFAPFQGHARRVATLAAQAGRLLGFDAGAASRLARAAHLHDIGQVSLPTQLWLQPRAWTSPERRRAQGHVAATERILAGAPDFAEVAELAASHHERLDARGYPRRSDRNLQDRSARLLAVADAASGMLETRAWRPGLPLGEVLDALRREAVDGALDRTCVDAVAAALTEQPFAPRAAGTLLSEREQQVLRALADGLTNKGIARVLGISHRTVQTHTLRIYEKLGVDSRAGAVLAATRKGLI